MLPSLGGKRTLRSVTVAFTLAVLLVGVLDANLLVHEVLSVHVLDSFIRGLECTKRDKTVALGQVAVVARDLLSLTLDACSRKAKGLTYLRGRNQAAESRKAVEENLLVDHGI